MREILCSELSVKIILFLLVTLFAGSIAIMINSAIKNKQEN